MPDEPPLPIQLTDKLIKRWQASPHYKPEQSLAAFVNEHGYDELVEPFNTRMTAHEAVKRYVPTK